MFSLDTATKAKPSKRHALSPAAQEREALLKIRRHMIDRCTKPGHPNFGDYGGRGITVCDAWLQTASAFVADVSPRPAGLTLERIENDKGYEPGNVRWATRAEQVRNRRNNVRVEIDGQLMVLVDACAARGMSYDAIWRRIRRGCSISEAFARPVQQRRITPPTN